MSITERGVEALFCFNRKCSNCPFSEGFKPDKFTRNAHIYYDCCKDACGDSMKDRTLLWLTENGGADSTIKYLGYHNSCIKELYDWCGYKPKGGLYDTCRKYILSHI